MPAKKPPRPCENCGLPAKPLRKGRCHTCDTYWRKRGIERPYSLDGRREKVTPTPCDRCGRVWAYVKGLCKSCYRVKYECERKGRPLPPFDFRRLKHDRYNREVELVDADIRLGAEIEALESRFSRELDDILRRVTALEAAVKSLSGTRKRREPVAVDDAAELLDSIARGMAKKPFSKLTSAHQDVVRRLADRVRSGNRPS